MVAVTEQWDEPGRGGGGGVDLITGETMGNHMHV